MTGRTAEQAGKPVTLMKGMEHPYRIYYRIAGDEFQIVRVYHQAWRSIEGRRRARRR